MRIIKHSAALVLFFFISAACFADPPSKRSSRGTRIYLGPVVGFYSINKKHARNPYPRFSAVAGFKREIGLGRDYQAYFLFGAEYLYHGLNFNSYYFQPGAVQVYDGSFGYNYSLLVHELGVPLQVKYLFNREDNSLFSPYVTVMYQLRFLLQGNVRITENGSEVRTDAPAMKFKTPLLYEKINSCVGAGVGWQKNSLSSKGASFFAELNFRYGFSPYFFSTGYAASSLYINSMHLQLQLGLKF
jgi:hypothetical protein